ncbi:hypothetical protein FACS1894196_3070 [Clostridia bacterium]|nr:hypothetical protein FACS1894196_3070 [Clostridia bacterium]
MRVKRLLALLACLTLCAASVARARAEDAPQPLYQGYARNRLTIHADMSRESEAVGVYQQGERVLITGVDPSWLKVAREERGAWQEGYVLRHSVVVSRALADGVLPYGATPGAYTATLGRNVTLRSAPSERGGVLFTLTKGTRIAIVRIENGWAQVIYWRQYGYFPVSALETLTPVYGADAALEGDVVGAFVSFYTLPTTEDTINRLTNIRQACADIAVTVASGKKFEFDAVAGPYNEGRGYAKAVAFANGGVVLGYGGGVCQVSSTLYNVLLALPGGIDITYRRSHGPGGATYLPHGVDAAVGNENLDLRFVNRFPFPIYIDAGAQDGVLYVALRRGGETQ